MCQRYSAEHHIIDADLGVAELAAGIFGSKNWMSELARFAGSRTSVRKANSSR